MLGVNFYDNKCKYNVKTWCLLLAKRLFCSNNYSWSPAATHAMVARRAYTNSCVCKFQAVSFLKCEKVVKIQTENWRWQHKSTKQPFLLPLYSFLLSLCEKFIPPLAKNNVLQCLMDFFPPWVSLAINQLKNWNRTQ